MERKIEQYDDKYAEEQAHKLELEIDACLVDDTLNYVLDGMDNSGLDLSEYELDQACTFRDEIVNLIVQKLIAKLQKLEY